MDTETVAPLESQRSQALGALVQEGLSVAGVLLLFLLGAMGSATSSVLVR